MPSDLKNRINEDTKACMRAKDKERLGVLRLVNAAIKQVEVDTRTELGDEDVLAVLEKMLKQRRESLEQYTKADRTDLADQEAFEIDLIQAYMPEELSSDEVDRLIDEAVAASGAQSMKDMGKVMGSLKPALKGRADMRAVSEKVKSRLS